MADMQADGAMEYFEFSEKEQHLEESVKSEIREAFLAGYDYCENNN